MIFLTTYVYQFSINSHSLHSEPLSFILFMLEKLKRRERGFTLFISDSPLLIILSANLAPHLNPSSALFSELKYHRR